MLFSLTHVAFIAILSIATVPTTSALISQHRSFSVTEEDDSITVDVSTTTGVITIHVDDHGEEQQEQQPWIRTSQALHLTSIPGWSKDTLSIIRHEIKSGGDNYGSYNSTTLFWGDKISQSILFITSVHVYTKRELVLFKQNFPVGWINPNNNNKTIIFGYPSIQSKSLEIANLKFLTWGGCQVSDVYSGLWNSTAANIHDMFDGKTSGEPLVLHKKKETLPKKIIRRQINNAQEMKTTRVLVLSPLDNFFVSGQAASNDGNSIDCGIRNTVQSLPKGFSHTSVLVGGRGINSTMIEWGNVLLDSGGKKRTNPYKEDFALSHLGYWTDNGAYYYAGTHTNYTNSEEALKAVKEDFKNRQIPVRYYQWDDWWMESKGDVPGIISWEPKKETFPSGFTDWLGLPLSLYAPMYSSENKWKKDYEFKDDPYGHKTSIPLDPNFYQDLFRNGTIIGMKMFEQDFLCSLNTDTGLTNTDVETGRKWIEHMDNAAMATGTTLQFCMMNPCHALHSTLVKSMTNGRATGDNTRNHDSLLSMGQDGLLFYSLGFFPSRDNVWTTNPTTEQPSCGKNRYCYEPNAHADNAVAVLSGGPYGIADAAGYGDYSVIMRSCRADGVLLKSAWPLSSLDFTFTDDDAIGTFVWAAHDDHAGEYRWSYVIGVNNDRPVVITPERLQGISPRPSVAWKVDIGQAVTSVIPFLDKLILERSPKKSEKAASISHYAVAPVMPNGLAILGDVSKWATMSNRRFCEFVANETSVTATVLGSPGEKISISYVLPPLSTTSKVLSVECNFASIDNCKSKDDHGNKDCRLQLYCDEIQCFCKRSVLHSFSSLSKGLSLFLRGNFERY